MRVYNHERGEIEKRTITGISLDSNGVHIGTDLALQIYFWNHVHEVWLPIQCFDPDRKEDS